MRLLDIARVQARVEHVAVVVADSEGFIVPQRVQHVVVGVAGARRLAQLAVLHLRADHVHGEISEAIVEVASREARLWQELALLDRIQRDGELRLVETGLR